MKKRATLLSLCAWLLPSLAAAQTTVALLNSEGGVVASYAFNTKSGQVETIVIGGQTVSTFTPFILRSQGNGYRHTL